MFYFLFLLTTSILNYNSEMTDNYVEVEIKYEQNNHIQLFAISSDSLSYFTEKQSYWERVDSLGTFVKVRWTLRNVEYNKFRIDLATKANQLIEIKSILIHVNGERIKLKGMDILDFFEPNSFLELKEFSAESIVFKSISINDLSDPSLVQSNWGIAKTIAPNTSVKISIISKGKGMLTAKLHDSKGLIYGSSICIDTSTRLIKLPFYTPNPPTYLSIEPSKSNEIKVRILKLSVSYYDNQLFWDPLKIQQEFKTNGDFYALNYSHKGMFIQTKNHYPSSSFKFWNENLEFHNDYLKRMIYGFCILSIISFSLVKLNKITLSNFKFWSRILHNSNLK